LARGLKLINRFFNFQFLFSGLGEPRTTETADTESVDTVARLYLLVILRKLFSIVGQVNFFFGGGVWWW
jgi:hypothetical protein